MGGRANQPHHAPLVHVLVMLDLELELGLGLDAASPPRGGHLVSHTRLRRPVALCSPRAPLTHASPSHSPGRCSARGGSPLTPCPGSTNTHHASMNE
uniref:Uncharacterized protein n=1 Tax=Physcomitrium patens TaxID=3218 RepID=A0A2K1KZQ1_PHYPA|nr:hypothetical protein PHYPA_002045 [Physcomitrium patens]